MNLRAPLAIGLCFLLIACHSEPESPTPETQPLVETPSPVAAAPREEVTATTGDSTLIVFLGDSLTAGFGLGEAQAFPAIVEKSLIEAGHAVRVVNAGSSGDTTAGGLARLDWLLRQEPDILVVGLGGNDGLRGVSLESSEANLRAILERTQSQDIRLLLAGMLIPPNYGQDYTEHFAGIYPKLAGELDIPLIPFLLEGVAAQPDLNLADGIHPNAQGQLIVARTVLEHLRPLVEDVEAEAEID